jgi:integrase
VWSVVEQAAKEIGIEHFGVHDLRRTCAKICRKNGGDLEQIKFLLGHASIQTTERYLGTEQRLPSPSTTTWGYESIIWLATLILSTWRFHETSLKSS